MSYIASDFKDLLYRLMPKGPVWPVDAEATPVWDSLLDALSQEPARVAAIIQSIPEALLPASTMRSEFLDLWEAILGLTAVPVDADRITAILAVLGQNISPSKVEIQAYATALKTSAVTDHAFKRFTVGTSVIGEAVYGSQWAATWGVTYIGPQDLAFEAALRAVAPANTTLLFIVS